MAQAHGCLICAGSRGDDELRRVEVWRDPLWRLSTSITAPVVGSSTLEPLRHIAHVTDLDGEEAATLGAVLARVARTLREVTRAELVYVNVLGERIAHPHFDLAPHRTGDQLRGGPAMVDPDASLLSLEKLGAGADRMPAAMAS